LHEPKLSVAQGDVKRRARDVHKTSCDGMRRHDGSA